MHRGYVKLWRCIEDSGLVGQPTAFYLYSYLLLKATHKPKSVVVGGAVFNLEPGEAVIGRNKISEATGLTVRQIRTALELLKKLSLIASRTTNKCTIVSINNWGTYQGNQEQSGQQNDQQTGQQPASNRPADDQQAASARPATGQRPATIQEYKNIRTEEDNTPLTPQGGRRAVVEEYSDEFELFWREYPNHNSGKKKAYSAFKRALKKATLAELLKSLDAHKKSSQWTKDGGAYIPHATTWLNGERWTVELGRLDDGRFVDEDGIVWSGTKYVCNN